MKLCTTTFVSIVAMLFIACGSDNDSKDSSDSNSADTTNQTDSSADDSPSATEPTDDGPDTTELAATQSAANRVVGTYTGLWDGNNEVNPSATLTITKLTDTRIKVDISGIAEPESAEIELMIVGDGVFSADGSAVDFTMADGGTVVTSDADDWTFVAN